MLIKCQACGHENQLGSIFCRNCGEKLDIDATRPETVDHSKKNRWPQLVRRVVTLIIFLILAYVLFAAFVPSGSAVYPSLTEEQTEEAAKLARRMRRASRRHKLEERTFVISPQDATVIFKHEFRNEEGKTPIIIKTDPRSGQVSFSYTKNLVGPVSLRYTLVGRPENPDLTGDSEAESEDTEKDKEKSDKDISLFITGAKIGRLSLPSFSRSLVVDKFAEVPKSEKFQEFRKSIAKVEIDDEGNFVVTIKPHKRHKRRHRESERKSEPKA